MPAAAPDKISEAVLLQLLHTHRDTDLYLQYLALLQLGY
jgi:hypothetical protein